MGTKHYEFFVDIPPALKGLITRYGNAMLEVAYAGTKSEEEAEEDETEAEWARYCLEQGIANKLTEAARKD